MGTIVAKFSSKCGKCRNMIVAGAKVNWTKGLPAEHVTCPTVADVLVTTELDGVTMRARLAQLEAALATHYTIMRDVVLEAVGCEPTTPCAVCKGTGRVTSKFNMSDTMDFSDWQHFTHPCGTRLDIDSTSAEGGWIRGWNNVRVTPVGVLPEVGSYEYQNPEYDARRAAFQDALNAVPLAVQTHYETGDHETGANRWYSWHAAGMSPSKTECVSNAAVHNHWSYEYRCTESMYRDAHPELAGLEQLIKWMKSDLVPRVGDMVTVINRGKERAGVAVFVGAGYSQPYSRVTPPDRVQVDPRDGSGKKYGGDLATAVLVKRLVTVPTRKH